MKKVAKDARLHEKTVQEVAGGAPVYGFKSRRPIYPSRPKHRMTTSQIHPLLLEWAKSQGVKITDPRLEVISPMEAVLHNNPV